MNPTRCACAVFLCAAVIAAQEASLRSPRFFDAGWNNVHRATPGRITKRILDDLVQSPASVTSDYVFRPADHYADGTAQAAPEGFVGETLSFPVEIFGTGERALTPWMADALPADFEAALLRTRTIGRHLMHLRLEHSVDVGVRRRADGTIESFAAQLAVGTANDRLRVLGGEIDEVLPPADAQFVAGWHASWLDQGVDALPEPLREIARAAPEIPVVDRIEATVVDTWFDTEGQVAERFEFTLRGAVAADGRFAIERTAEYLDEDGKPVPVTFEVSCDLRGLCVGIKGWPVRCVWPRNHEDIADVLLDVAGPILPLVGWARDPYWMPRSSRTAWSFGQGPNGSTWVAADWPGTGLGGSLEYVIDESTSPPRVVRLNCFDGSLTRFDDERELAPGFRRPMNLVTWWGEGKSFRKREVTIAKARISNERAVPSWRPGGTDTRWYLMR